MASLMFRCPYTGLNVPYLRDDDASRRDKGDGASRQDEKSAPDRQSEYEAVTCPACTRLHFVNKATGKTLSENKSGA
jgi:hypothetical protein